VTPADMEEALREVALLEKELGRRRPEIKKQKDYYRGKHSLKFASAEYREWFGENYQGFADNWCAPVVEALTERQKPIGIRPKGALTTDSKLRGYWEESGAAGGAPLAFNTKATAARVFALVWSKDADGTPEVTFEDPSQAIVSYEPGSRRKRRSALKLWHGDDDDFATLYTPDAVWKFQRRRFGAELSSLVLSPEVRASLGGWQPRKEKGDDVWPIPNPLERVPMVELQNRPDLIDEPMSEIDGVISMQDAINALWAFLFTGADFAALPQRVILGAQLSKIPILDEQGQKVGEKVLGLEDAQIKRILSLESPNAKIDQWDAANLEIFTKVIEKAANHIGNQTRTPLYYFASSIQNISGDTLKALETGLVSKVGERMETDDEPLRELHWLMAKVAGDDALAEKVRGGTVIWADHESRSEAQKVDALAKLKDIGFPFEYIAEQYVGGDADELERIMKMYKAQATEDPLFKLANRERQLNGAGQQDGPPSGADPAAKPPADQQPKDKAA
jgi:hypothetical protein